MHARVGLLVIVMAGCVWSRAGHAAQAVPAHLPPLHGVVVDVSGGAVPGATVEALGAVPVRVAVTDHEGRFRFGGLAEHPPGLRVSAPGFTQADLVVAAAPPGESIRVVLVPASLDETVTVTASRGAGAFAGAPTTTVVSAATLVSAGAGAIDDALRYTPGFSLFRRSTSRVANPTTQGVTLRGVSGSGASRSSVLADGVPLNDPFGSWVYWNRIPLVSIDRIEVMRGAGGDLYGAEALGGVVQVVTHGAGQRGARVLADYGTQDTVRVSGLVAARRGGWSASGTAEWYDTTGAFVVADADRGAVDAHAASEYLSSGARVTWSGRGWEATVRVRASDEQRANGTPLQVNDTNWRQWSGDASGPLAGGTWSLRAVAGTQGYYQTFSAILAARAGERLTSEQRIPATHVLGQAQWARAWRRAGVLLGTESHRTRATQTERRYGATGALIEQAVTGGTERALGAFVRGSFSPVAALTLVGGARVDRAETTPLATSLPRHTATMMNPRVNVAWRLTDRWSVHASAYRSSRTPTLNERYRAFRVGTVLTNANAALRPERVTGADGGLAWRGRRQTVRASAYWNNLEDAVTNVTIASTPAQTTRQRQNADTLRARGVEVEAEWRPSSWLTLSALGVAGRARFADAPAQPQLVGNDVPQAPRHQAAVGAVVMHDLLGTLTLQARRVGRQFDDDLNALALAPFAVVDASVLRPIARGVSLALAVENLFDTEYDVGRTPTRSIGWPRAVRISVRWFGRR